MTSSNPRERFLQLEENATVVLRQLELLKQETQNYSEASHQLESIAGEIYGLINALEGVAGALQIMASGLQEAGVPAILEKVTVLESQIDKVRLEAKEAKTGTDDRLDSVLEYLSKGFFGRLFGKPRESSMSK